MKKNLKLKKTAVKRSVHEANVKRGRNAKRKGSDYERKIAKLLGKRFGIELKRTPQSGGFAKSLDTKGEFRGDITVIDKLHDFLLHIECKNTKTWSLPAWLRQAEGDCPKGKIPVVVFHQFATSNSYVCLKLEDFLEVCDTDKVVTDREEN